MDQLLAAQAGPLACERMVDILNGVADSMSRMPEPTPKKRLVGWCKATWRRVFKTCNAYLPGSFKSVAFERQRYPGITPGELAERIARFQQVLGEDAQLQLRQIRDKIFKISR